MAAAAGSEIVQLREPHFYAEQMVRGVCRLGLVHGKARTSTRPARPGE